MKRIRIGVIGLGWVATHRHLIALKRSDQFEIAGVADRDADLAQHWAKKLEIPYHCSAKPMSGISWLPHVEAIDVATAPMSHFEYAKWALGQGKHVITEKPFAMSVAEGEQLVDLARSVDRQLAIVHNFQFSSSVGKLIADLNCGKLGQIKSIVAFQWGNPLRRLPQWYEQLPAGLFFDESPHLLYLIRRLAPGPLQLVSVDSCKSTLGKSTPASIDVSYRSHVGAHEIPVSVNCRFEAPLSEWHVCVLGEKAAGLVDVFRDIYLRLSNDGGHATAQVLRTSLSATTQHWLRHLVNGPRHLSGRLLYGNQEIFKRFASAINLGSPAVDMAGSDALAVLKMQFEIIERLTTRCDSISSG
jgi:scyllo-inositol 2-dehydrogenase (NADP+)